MISQYGKLYNHSYKKVQGLILINDFPQSRMKIEPSLISGLCLIVAVTSIIL